MFGHEFHELTRIVKADRDMIYKDEAFEQVYLAASRLRLGLLVNFGGESLEWKRVVL